MTVKALISYMLTQSAITDITGTRITPGHRTQGADLPACTVHHVSGVDLYADDGEVGLVNPRIQIDCYGETYGDAKDLAEAVKGALSAVQDLTHDGVNFIYIMLDLEQDIQEGGSNTSEYLAHTALDFTIWTGE